MANELNTRSTVVAVTKEVTQNTLVAPSSGADFIPILDNISVEPAFDEIQSTELVNSIGKGKPTKGAENPVATVSVYLKHSGVEGQAPNWGPLLESCLGAKSTAAAEYDTIASSTTTLLKVNTGEGASFERGEAVMVKDSSMTNGYQIRNISSISGDDISLAQALPSAPTSGINLGKAILYKPANSDHPSLSLWDYRANGGALQVVGGGRAVSLSSSIAAGSPIQADFSVEGIEFYFDPFIISSINKWIDFNEGGSELNASIAEKVYKDPYDLASAIETAMNNVATATITCAYDDSTRKFTLTSNGATFQLLFKTGVHGSDNTDTHIGTIIGFADTADLTAALTYTSSTAASFSAYYENPAMIVSATNKFIDFNEGGAEINVTLTEATYATPYALAEHIQTAMNAAATANIICKYNNSTKKFTFVSDGATFAILWKTGVHGSDNTDTHVGTLLGFSDAADDTAALTYASDTAITISSGTTPTFDSVDMNIAKNNQTLIGGVNDYVCFRASELTFNVSHDHTKIDDICATSGRSGSLFTGRTTIVDVKSYLVQGQAEEFKKFRANDQITFTFNCGQKSGGNWVPGTAVNIHMPTATISSFKLSDSNGLVTLEMTLTGYATASQDEVFINFL